MATTYMGISHRRRSARVSLAIGAGLILGSSWRAYESAVRRIAPVRLGPRVQRRVVSELLAVAVAIAAAAILLKPFVRRGRSSSSRPRW
jgi:hypothetical protein